MMTITEWVFLGAVVLLLVAAFLSLRSYRDGKMATPKYVHALVSLSNLIIMILLIAFDWRAEWLFWALFVVSLAVSFYFQRRAKEAGPSAEDAPAS